MRTVSLFFILSTVTGAHGSFVEGETCGINSANFFQPDFVGEYRIAGPAGCNFGEDKDCLCAVNYDAEDILSDWIWQCNGKVAQGPASGKVCPVDLPVIKPVTGVSPDEVACSMGINPTGRSGDPICHYSTCATGGNDTAVCGCVDPTSYGAEGSPKWICLYSTCSCGDPSAEPETGSDGLTFTVYETKILPVGTGINTGVSGDIIVSIAKDGVVSYSGTVSGLEPDLQPMNCTALNGCGVHIHNGTSCGNTTTQGGHYFTSPVTVDPWIDARYSTNEFGITHIADSINIGTDQINGRPFIVHSQNGTRIGCGILTPQPKKKLGECETDCDKDSDCKGKLICADQHKKELRKAGYDPRKANCDTGSRKDRYLEVCFDPSILNM